MEVSCNDCKNKHYTNCIDSVEYSCKNGHEINWDKHKCEDFKPLYVKPSEDYKKGYLHGYNTCRREMLKAIENIKCTANIPKKIDNEN